jgi:hypothetical protein
MTGNNPGYLDSVEFRWEGNLTLMDYNTGHIAPTYLNETERSIIWRNPDVNSAPTGYEIILSRD